MLALESATMTFGERLLTLRSRLGLTQEKMADYLGITRPYYWQLEKDLKTPGNRLQKDVELLERTPTQKRSLPDTSRETVEVDTSAPGVPATPVKPSSRGDIMRDVEFIRLRYIPVVAWARAGSAITYDDLPTEHIDRIPADVPDQRAFALNVRGDSMEPAIREGDNLILLPSQEARSGEVAAVLLNDGTVMVKQVQFSRDKKSVTLFSYNPSHKPKEYSMAEVARIVPVHAIWKPIREA